MSQLARKRLAESITKVRLNASYPSLIRSEYLTPKSKRTPAQIRRAERRALERESSPQQKA